MTAFSKRRADLLRKAARRAGTMPDDLPAGWTKSPIDAMDLLASFPALRLRDGHILVAYVFREGGNGNGIVWAIPEHVGFPSPDECVAVEDAILSPPRPAGALDDLMSAVDGDGTPWSYLSGSIFAREAAEFGAQWHGTNWGDHEILGRDPWTASRRTARERELYSCEDVWVWEAKKPKLWKPTVEEIEGAIKVSFLTHSGQGQAAIYLHVDRFVAGQYTFEPSHRILAHGPGGFVY